MRKANKALINLILTLAMIVMPACFWAQNNAEPILLDVLDFKQTQVLDVFKLLSLKSGMNINYLPEMMPREGKS